MLNMQGLIDRYKGKTRHGNSVTGFLAWGGKSYYVENSSEPLSLNSTFGTEFIINRDGLVEEYKINEGVDNTLYFSDEELTKQISYDEFVLLEAKHYFDENFRDNHTMDNPDRTTYTYRLPISGYYPHPWYPNEEIRAFKVIRIMPFWELGKEYTVDIYRYIYSDNLSMRLSTEQVLQSPEFWQPIYQKEELNAK